MGPVAKLRLTNLAFMLSTFFTLGSTAAMLVTFNVTSTDPTTEERVTEHLFGREWYREQLFGIIPEQGIVLGLVAMFTFVCLFIHYHNRTSSKDIEAANAAAAAWIKRNGWKVVTAMVVLALIPAMLIDV